MERAPIVWYGRASAVSSCMWGMLSLISGGRPSLHALIVQRLGSQNIQVCHLMCRTQVFSTRALNLGQQTCLIETSTIFEAPYYQILILIINLFGAPFPRNEDLFIGYQNLLHTYIFVF